jgi:hypothetical protein
LVLIFNQAGYRDCLCYVCWFNRALEFASLSEKSKGKVLFSYTCWLLVRRKGVLYSLLEAIVNCVMSHYHLGRLLLA